MQVPPRQALVTTLVLGALAVTTACGTSDRQESTSSSASDSVAVTETPEGSTPGADDSASPSASASNSPSGSPSASASSSASASASGTVNKTTAPSGHPQSGTTTEEAAAPPPAPSFPVPVSIGDATQIITVKASGSYATVTAWAKESSGWKAQFSTTAGRVGSNGVTNGETRRQSTYTTPTGTYTITEGFGVQSSGGTAMPYTVVNDSHWWVQDPESKFYNQMHTEEGADFPLTESGERGSEHLINYPTQYAKALVINFNRWPATPGRGAGIFLHVNGRGATAGCVSVPRATMDRFMTWIKPGAHPRIAIG